MVQPVKIIVADIYPVVRKGISVLLGAEPGFEVIGEARDGFEAADQALELKPDVIVIDVFACGSGGLDRILVIKQKCPDTRVVVFTTSEREEDLIQSLRFGAHGYLLKNATSNELVEAVRRAAEGEVVLSPRMASKLARSYQEARGGDPPSLSSREMEVLLALAEGLSDVEIANRLFIGKRTVRTYLRRLLDKLHLKNRVEAAAYSGDHYPRG